MADDYAGYFSNLEQQYGLPSGYLAGASGIESHGGATPDRAGSQYQGMFQLGSGVRATYGVTDPQNWQQNAQGAAQYAADNMKQLKKAGVEPTAANLYLAHQQGAGGAISLINAGDKPAGTVANPNFITSNGGDPSAPASAFVNMWGSRFNGAVNRGAPGMAGYAPIGPNPSSSPAVPAQTASGMLAAAPEWVQTALKSSTLSQDVQKMATAFQPPQNVQAQPAQQPNLVQMGNQMAMQQQQNIQQRARDMLAALASKRTA